MSQRRSIRAARARAASALMAYLRDPCPSTERSLLAATHELEAAAGLRRRATGSPRRRAAQLRQLVAH